MLDPLTFEAWLEAERTWMQYGLCRTGKLPGIAWRCGENPEDATIRIAGRDVKCDEVTKMAVMICQVCPVQWSCARFSIDIEAEWGTFGCRRRHMRWLQEIEYWDAMLIIDDAEKLGTPVEIAVPAERKARRTTGMKGRPAA